VSALSWAILGVAMQWTQTAERPAAGPIAAQLASLLTQGLPLPSRA